MEAHLQASHCHLPRASSSPWPVWSHSHQQRCVHAAAASSSRRGTDGHQVHPPDRAAELSIRALCHVRPLPGSPPSSSPSAGKRWRPISPLARTSLQVLVSSVGRAPGCTALPAPPPPWPCQPPSAARCSRLAYRGADWLVVVGRRPAAQPGVAWRGVPTPMVNGAAADSD